MNRILMCMLQKMRNNVILKLLRMSAKKIEAYMDIYVRQQYVPQKSYMEILLMTLLDIAVTSTEKERVLGFNNFWRRINNIIKNK